MGGTKGAVAAVVITPNFIVFSKVSSATGEGAGAAGATGGATGAEAEGGTTGGAFGAIEGIVGLSGVGGRSEAILTVSVVLSEPLGGLAINGAGAFIPESVRGGSVILSVSDFTGVPVRGASLTAGLGLLPEGGGGTGNEFSGIHITYGILKFLQLKNRNDNTYLVNRSTH